MNLIIRRFADAGTCHGSHTVCVSGHTTFPPHYHHRDPRVTVTVWRKTPSLQLLVLTRVFVTLFIGQHLLYTATCFTSLVRVAATSCGHMFPPTHATPVSLCARSPNRWCVDIRPRAFSSCQPPRPTANHHSRSCVSRHRCGCGTVCVRKI